MKNYWHRLGFDDIVKKIEFKHQIIQFEVEDVFKASQK